MSVMFRDIKARLNTRRQNEPVDGIKFAEILYADDTLLVGDNSRILNLFVAAIEKHSYRYGMKLNKSKCEAVNSKSSLQIGS